jgi:hypothetical protein
MQYAQKGVRRFDEEDRYPNAYAARELLAQQRGPRRDPRLAAAEAFGLKPEEVFSSMQAPAVARQGQILRT